VYDLLLSSLVDELKPQNALEVGCGNGLNLFVLSALHPATKWGGVELTESGVAVARAIQQEPELPKNLQDFAPGTLASVTAHREIQIQQGNVLALPFPDRSFDLVFTVLALEQMQAIGDQALSEIARVARRHAVFIEPFAEFNSTETRKHYLRHRGYLDLPVSELKRFGLDVIDIFEDMPQKLTIGAGLVICRCHS
jgi:ubiquinone/menaquinone biosynthesis C-methylase UbiE